MTITMLANKHWGPITINIAGKEIEIPGCRRPNGAGGHVEFKFGYIDNVDKKAWLKWLETHGDLDFIANKVIYELPVHEQQLLRARDAKGGSAQPVARPDPRGEQVRPMGHVGSNPMKFPT